MMQYWARHCYPWDFRSHAAHFDEAILEVVELSLGSDALADPLLLRRLRLPARMYGGGMRSTQDVSSAAFVGTLCRSVPFLIDRADEQWNIRPGFLPQLHTVLGHGAFDDAQASAWFTGLLASGTNLGYALAYTWLNLQGEVGSVSDGLLASPASRAGAGECKVQRDLTVAIETKRFADLDLVLRSLPVNDMRRTAWLNLDKNSTVWVSSWPAGDAYLSNPEFGEIASFYFGRPSPVCRQAVGEPIGRTGLVLDAYGLRLTTAALPGDGWRTQHDTLKWRLHQDAREMAVRLRTEVYGLFAACLPQHSRSLGGMPPRKRQGLVPDFMFTVALDGPERELLFELKTLHVGTSTYPASGHPAMWRSCP